MNKLLGIALLVAGTCIGAAMLALPLKTAAAGFVPSLAILVTVWAIMTYTAFCLLEVVGFNQNRTNFYSMAHSTLGMTGGRAAWGLYLIFLYCLVSAYTAGSVSLLQEICATQWHLTLNHQVATLLVITPCALAVCISPQLSDYFNRILMVALALTYGLLSFTVAQQGQGTLDTTLHYSYIPHGFPIAVTAFGFHHLIPSLADYAKDRPILLKRAILIGSLIPLGVYILWQYIIMSVFPIWGPSGLVALAGDPTGADKALIHHLNAYHNGTSLIIFMFLIFAILSSFVGVALGICDFFIDAFQLKRAGCDRLKLASLTFLPPILFNMLLPGGFLLALEYASVFAAILLILFPVAMLYAGRYYHGFKSIYPVSGQKSLLISTFLFGCSVIVLALCLK